MRCVVIHGIQEPTVIPDLLLKKLQDVTLIQRTVSTALSLVPPKHAYAICDREDVDLVCSRNGIQTVRTPGFNETRMHIPWEVRKFLAELAQRYRYIILITPYCPLVRPEEIEEAFQTLVHSDSNLIVSTKKEEHSAWLPHQNAFFSTIYNDSVHTVDIHIRAFSIVKSALMLGNEAPNVIPFNLGDHSIEISSYQDWWICERLLSRKRILFVVAGYPAIGLGHVYRCLMLAHEIHNHEILFLCTKESELAAVRIAAHDYQSILQSGNLVDSVLALQPDIVINDFLDTDASYITKLKNQGISVVNFEDEGSGAEHADLVFNALYEKNGGARENTRYGHQYFCLRDEFIGCNKPFAETVRSVLLTFGGTDFNDYSRKVLDTILDECKKRNITINIVTGPGYLFIDEMTRHIETLGYENIHFTYATKIISSVMERSDIAVSSAGRTCYELAHMNIPAIVLSHHEREARHTFACEENGFINIGVMEPFDSQRMKDAFAALLDDATRLRLYNNMTRHDFIANKSNVINEILTLLESHQ